MFLEHKKMNQTMSFTNCLSWWMLKIEVNLFLKLANLRSIMMKKKLENFEQVMDNCSHHDTERKLDGKHLSKSHQTIVLKN